MIRSRTLTCCVAGVVLATCGLGAQNRAKYRDFELGATLASISALSGLSTPEARVVSKRPALLQELEWRPAYWVSGSSNRQTDPVERILFSFHNDQLFKMVVDYDRQRTEGMTDRDLIEALAVIYGTPAPSKPASAVTPSLDRESGTPIARWGNSDYSVVLFKTPYVPSFRLMVTSSTLEAQARTAAAEALRLDARDAPQLELARQRKEADDTKVSQEKLREANKTTFRP